MTRPYVDPDGTLGVERTATAAEIKQAYFTLVRIHSPKRDPETFNRVRSAYERLRDQEQRQQTDMVLLNTWPAPTRKHRPPQLDLALHREDVLADARALTDLERSDWREYYAKVKL